MEVYKKLNSSTIEFWISSFLVSVMISLWAYALFGVASEEHQGEVYRILYLHVPVVFTAFFLSFVLFVLCLVMLRRPHGRAMYYSLSCAEMGFLFTLITLASGSIWGRPTWGAWWTWDARLTTTFILALLYGGFILLWNGIPSKPLRSKACSILGILIFADIPIIYKSVTWWRTLHQPPSLLSSAPQSPMASEIRNLLLMCCVSLLLVGIWMVYLRGRNLLLADKLENLQMKKIRSL